MSLEIFNQSQHFVFGSAGLKICFEWVSFDFCLALFVYLNLNLWRRSRESLLLSHFHFVFFPWNCSVWVLIIPFFSINSPQSISSLWFRFISLLSSFFIYCFFPRVQIKTLDSLKPWSMAMKPNGKSIVSSDYDEKVMFFKDLLLGHHEAQLRFRLIHFWEAWNPLKKTLIGMEMLLIDEQVQ